MVDNLSYRCETAIAFFTFNRPELTLKTFEAIREVRPKKIYFISDGPRINVNTDIKLVADCRSISDQIDWDCEIIKVFSKDNLGCLQRIVTGLNYVFNNEDRAIIIEDDCLPTVDFFKFCEWGLQQFECDNDIGMISGSNLISHKFEIKYRNGFSSYINIWGWATWKKTWLLHNPFLSYKEVKSNLKNHTSHLSLNNVEYIFWKELLKFTLYEGSTWDFQLQYTFFKFKLKSVYPRKNLVFNTGFTGDGTHTNINVPEYVKLTNPFFNTSTTKLETDLTKNILLRRDKLLVREIWGLSYFSTLKLTIMNLLRVNL